ncbi:cytochrome c oxidase accessory protein CcoG [Marinihelvus fidelis]|uniref:Cytochrome c oxidase accessory protein CcoG n=1 Tax=Marinihelvus fidelis TaxID=2613842 RepID=A0A5N0TDN1_9GAMM|nr:cytochrome c oxidase accessory protein CcoG [Marinihelvus fidelis]KAA9132574.1 cytochrome c oxidase accessory protein CcoG [Marinihelvus fidelis]
MSAQAGGETLYRKEPKVYPRHVKGTYARLRKVAVFVLLGLYYLLPWLNWNGHQSVLFDLPARHFYIFGLTFFPQDFIYLALLLIAAGLTLFFFTALAGRLWCGYACPQTVWTETFMWIEQWTEGDRNKRMKLDKGPWNSEKILRKGGKQALWVTFALWTGFTFVGFFTPIRELGQSVLALSLGPWETFWILFYSFATYGNAGLLREQVCKYMCPYARFQGAMFDRDTLIISYDEARGEPRGGRRKGDDPAALGLGDCIGCTLCVQVCPTGIDIRDGLQVECIACAACVDVCDQVMDKMGYEPGLIRYTTENALEKQPTRVLRPRIIIYGTLLFALLAGIGISLTQRTLLRAELINDRNQLYRELADGQVENIYTLKLVNVDHRDHAYVVSVPAHEGVQVEVAPTPVLGAEQVGEYTLTLRAPAGFGRGAQDIEIRFQAEDDAAIDITRTVRMILPFDR